MNMNSNDLTPAQRVQKNSLAVMTHAKYRPLGGVIMSGTTTVEDNATKCPTAYTDGYNVVYGAEYIPTLSDPEVRFLVLHENLHKALRHLSTWRPLWLEDPKLANTACDYVINLLLVLSDAGEGFIKMPAEGCLDVKYKGMDAGEVYRLLKKEGKGGAGQPQGFDSHGWEEAAKRTPEQAQALEKEMDSAMQQGNVLAGKMGGDLDRATREVLAPTVNWGEELREYVMSLCAGREMSTWRKPHRRSIDTGNYTPSTYSEAVGRLAVGIDTSGSVSGEIVGRFLGEVVSIAETTQPELIDLIYWDGKVQGHEKYGPGEYETLRVSTKPKGGGGTKPSCVSEYLKKTGIKPECVVMLTDGYVGSDWGGNWGVPVLWCIVGNKRTTATTGKTIHIKER